jgi:hypothetical protein
MLLYLYAISEMAMVLAVCAVEAGIMELSSELVIDGYPACTYQVTSPDLNTAKKYSVLPGEVLLPAISVL